MHLTINNYDNITGLKDHLCCHKWSPRTVYAQTIVVHDSAATYIATSHDFLDIMFFEHLIVFIFVYVAKLLLLYVTVTTYWNM